MEKTEITTQSRMTRKKLIGPTYSEIHNVEMGLGEYFFETVEKFEDRLFQIDTCKNRSETFGQVKQKAVRVALYLQEIGIKPGDVVMPFCSNNIDNIVPVLATLFLGAIVCSLDLRLDLFDIKNCINVAKPKIIFVVEERVELLEKALREIQFETKIVAIGGHFVKYPNMYDLEKTRLEEEDGFKPSKVDVKKDIAFVLFSSGTTNLPKGVIWSHETVLHECIQQKRSSKPSTLKNDIQCTSMFWNIAVWTTANCIVNAIPTITTGYNPSEKKLIEVIDKYQIEIIYFSATMINRILSLPEEIFQSFNTSSIKYISVGGSPIDAESILNLRKKFPGALVLQRYGSTELGGPPFRWPLERDISKEYTTKVSSAGTLGFNLEAKIVDVITGELLGPNQEGEILIKARFPTLGFYNNPIYPQMFDEEGFLRTGDLGYYDEDEFFYVVERINEIYKYQAYRVCPAITENLLRQHPAIKEAAVVGIPHQIDEYHGAACLVLNKGFDISLEEINKYIFENLGDIYLLRKGVKFVKEIPSTPSSKLKRRAIKDMFLQNQ